jgi:hypothetical protein
MNSESRLREIEKERKEISDELGNLLLIEMDILTEMSIVKNDPDELKRKSSELSSNKARQQVLDERDRVLEREERRLSTRRMVLQMKKNRENTEAWLNATMAKAQRNAEQSQKEVNSMLKRMGMEPLYEKVNTKNEPAPKTRGATRFCSSIVDCFRKYTRKNTNKKKGGRRLATRRN